MKIDLEYISLFIVLSNFIGLPLMLVRSLKWTKQQFDEGYNFCTVKFIIYAQYESIDTHPIKSYIAICSQSPGAKILVTSLRTWYKFFSGKV